MLARTSLRRRVRGAAPLAAAVLVLSGCPEPSSEGGAPVGSTPVASALVAAPAPPPISPEEVAFPRSTPLLATLPAAHLLPRGVTAVFAVRSPAEVLPGLARFDEAKGTLAQALDELADGAGGDLPKLTALAESGLDPAQPMGLVAFEARFDTLALFASVGDEAAMRAWLEQRASLSRGARQLVTQGDALVLRAKSGASRAIVVRQKQVFFLWTREDRRPDPARVAAWVDGLTTGEESASLYADPSFSKAMSDLGFGRDGAIYVREGQTIDALLALHERVVDAAPGTTKARREKETLAALAPLGAAVGAVAAGFELGERALEVKTFVALTGAPIQLLGAPKRPVTLFDPALSARSALHAVIDPRLLAVLHDVVPDVFGKDPLPLREARGVLRAFGVPPGGLDPWLDGELATAYHDPSSKAFTVLWGVTDSAAVHALLEKGWTVQQKTGLARKGLAKRLGDDSFELAPAPPGTKPVRVRLVGDALLVTTDPAVADALPGSPARPLWMSTAEPPALAQLAAIDGVTARLALDHVPWDPGPRVEEGVPRDDFGVLGGVMGGVLGAGDADSRRRDALRDRRDALQPRIRELEEALDQHADTTWKAFSRRVGRVAFIAKPTDGGLLIGGGVFTTEPSLRALAEAWLGAWLAAGRGWVHGDELARLRAESSSLQAQLDARP